MDVKYPLADGHRAEDTRDDDTAQEENFHRVAREDAPDETRGEEAVVQSLIHGERLGLFGKFLRQAKGLHPARLVPQEHFEVEKAEVQEGDDNDKNIGYEFHDFSFVQIEILRTG